MGYISIISLISLFILALGGNILIFFIWERYTNWWLFIGLCILIIILSIIPIGIESYYLSSKKKKKVRILDEYISENDQKNNLMNRQPFYLIFPQNMTYNDLIDKSSNNLSSLKTSSPHIQLENVSSTGATTSSYKSLN